MNQVATLVQRTTYDSTPQDFRLPPFLWGGFTALNRTHGIWRWYRRLNVYANPGNLTYLLAGHTLNFVIGDIIILRIAAQVLLISTRILECVEQQSRLYKAGSLWKDAVLGRYEAPVKLYWKDSPFKSRCKIRAQDVINRTQRIAACTFSVLAEAFVLSMRILDAIDAFYLSPYTRAEAFNESFINGMKWIDAIVDNGQELLNGCIANQALIEKVLQGSPFTFEQIITGATKALEKTENFRTKTKKIAGYGNGILFASGKRTIDEIMVSFGLARWRPTWLGR